MADEREADGGPEVLAGERAKARVEQLERAFGQGLKVGFFGDTAEKVLKLLEAILEEQKKANVLLFSIDSAIPAEGIRNRDP